MNVLIACESSGIVRDAFAAHGHNAISCDLLPSERPGKHVQGDVLALLRLLAGYFDLMIAHPTCTHLASSGSRHFAAKRLDGRMSEGMDFFLELAEANVPKKAVENPVGIMSNEYRKPDQIIQPHMFGHPEFKATCLWLTGLDKLQPTNQLAVPVRTDEAWKSWNRVHRISPGVNRWRERSRTYQGVANAMAAQWG